MDCRDVAGHHRNWYDSFDEKRMVATVEVEDEDGERTVEVAVKFDVCGTCGGKGSHVNPSIDAHGISAEEFAEDPDFAADYFAGQYDQSCNECGGKRVVPVIDNETCDKKVAALVQDKIEAGWQSAREETHQRAMGF